MFAPSYVKEVRHLIKHAHKVLRYQRDLLKDAEISATEEQIAKLQRAANERNEEAVQHEAEQLDKQLTKIAPPRDHPGWRENCEVLLVAILIAVGIRAYYLQPF